jgi:hypothetical protein
MTQHFRKVADPSFSRSLGSRSSSTPLAFGLSMRSRGRRLTRRTVVSHSRISRTVGIAESLASTPSSRRTGQSLLVVVVAEQLSSRLFTRRHTLAYDKGWRNRVEWKQYQLLKVRSRSFCFVVGRSLTSTRGAVQPLLVDLAEARRQALVCLHLFSLLLSQLLTCFSSHRQRELPSPSAELETLR